MIVVSIRELFGIMKCHVQKSFPVTPSAQTMKRCHITSKKSLPNPEFDDFSVTLMGSNLFYGPSGVVAAVTASFFIICADPFASHILYEAGGSSSIAAGHLGCFQVLAITNNAAMNIVEHVSLWYDWAFFGYMPKSARTSSTILNKHGESGQPCLVPDFSGNALSFSPFNLMFAVGLL
ncbi:hypothetical protein STEG23_007559 [Scotinomys teguina]